MKAFFALLTIFASIISTNSVSAASDTLRFKDFEADYYLSRYENGVSNLHVVEKITAVLPTSNKNHGITRVIPFTTSAGTQLTMPSTSKLKIEVERNGQPERVSHIEPGDGYFEVFIGDADVYLHGEQVYTLTYDFENVITDQSEGDDSWQELYWDTNGNDWNYRFERVTARVHLDDNLIDAFGGRTACYVGVAGSSNTSRCWTARLDDGFEFVTGNLTQRENLTFVLDFVADTFTVIKKSDDLIWLIPIVLTAIMLIVTIIFAISAARAVKPMRKFYKDLPLVVEYIPPKGYAVYEMAKNYVGHKFLRSPETAGLLELAVTHKIELVKNPNYTGKILDTAAPWMIRIKSLDLTDTQRNLLGMLSPSANELSVGQEIAISRTASTTTTAQHLSFSLNLDKTMQSRGLIISKKSEKSASAKAYDRSTIGIVLTGFIYIALIVIIGAVIEEQNLGYGPTPIPYDALAPIGLFVGIFITIVTIIIVAASGNKYTTHTKKSLELSRYLDGMYEYIKMAEAERLKFYQSVKGADTTPAGIVKLYERLLPYAALFGLEKSWLGELSRYYEMEEVKSPNWYVGAAVFSASDFVSTLERGSNFVSTSTYSHSSGSGSSSGGSGFSSGGGHSGGGGGGGGGGGW